MKALGGWFIFLGIVAGCLAGYGQYGYNAAARAVGSSGFVDFALGLNSSMGLASSSYGASASDVFMIFCVSNRTTLFIVCAVLLIAGFALFASARKGAQR